MLDLTLMTSASDPAVVLPSLTLLSHRVRVLPLNTASLVKLPDETILFLDARQDLAGAKTLCSLIHAADLNVPIILVVSEGGFPAVNAQWGISDIIIDTASPAETEGRLRLARENRGSLPKPSSNSVDEVDQTGHIHCGDLVVDPKSYTATLKGRPIDLAYKEFELLKYLAQHPHHVFTRAQLLQEVWGYDYYGGTRTVDVHIRRLRAKLGGEYEHLIGTVRNVGYRFDPAEGSLENGATAHAEGPTGAQHSEPSEYEAHSAGHGRTLAKKTTGQKNGMTDGTQ
ncbi:transcriptional regulatory protein, C-terminal domain protein [Bifidobacterium bombi DSM 19703]|uniref:Transcriptional regulatory protein, C-terminal domain protein n=2 Tax=Bifidobacterium bombi TaxID=471511 RepID=A0A080N368_9BIFI|nr:response regulator transcription factor [Bifidobacterium bombi]KFF31547.1 transcriptional regulatory protein, C-terminal domain protein [Bifidobacterium bombi DSM 19703]